MTFYFFFNSLHFQKSRLTQINAGYGQSCHPNLNRYRNSVSSWIIVSIVVFFNIFHVDWLTSSMRRVQSFCREGQSWCNENASQTFSFQLPSFFTAFVPSDLVVVCMIGELGSLSWKQPQSLGKLARQFFSYFSEKNIYANFHLREGPLSTLCSLPQCPF